MASVVLHTINVTAADRQLRKNHANIGGTIWRTIL